MVGELIETFDEAYDSFKCTMRNMGDLILTILQALVWVTIPLWVLPYIAIKKLKEWYNGED